MQPDEWGMQYNTCLAEIEIYMCTLSAHLHICINNTVFAVYVSSIESSER